MKLRSFSLVLALLLIGMSFGNSTNTREHNSGGFEISTREYSEDDSIMQHPSDWSEDIMLSNWSFSAAHLPSMAVHGSNIHVAWEDWRLAREGRAFEVFYRRSTDNGITWSKEMMLSDDDIEGSGSPQIAVNADDVFVVWSDCRGFSVKELYYANSSDNGETWSENKALTSDDGFNSEWPLMALDEDIIHIVWGDERDGQYEVYYKNSNDGGVTWSEDRRLTNWTLGTDAPHGFDVHESYVHVLLTRYVGNWESFYMKSEDGGSTWSSPVPIADMDGRNSESGDLSASGSMVNICWMDAKSSVAEIFYRNSTDNGTTWNPEVRISNSSVEAGQCHMAISPPSIHFVWYDKKPGNAEIFYRNSTDTAVSWNEEVRLTYANGISAQPNIEVSGNYVHLVWLDKRSSEAKIFYKRYPVFPPETILPRPPRHLEATSENSGKDVRLAWKASTDENSLGGTIRYVVVRANDSMSPFVDVGEVQAIGVPSYSFIDREAGRGDPNQYRYYVESVDFSGNRNRSVQAGKYVLPLDAGKHLISIPFELQKKKTWYEMDPPDAPSRREGGAIAYDVVKDRAILFGGGGSFNDTWIYDVTNDIWTKNVTSTSPGKRWGARMAYCELEGKAVLFGGFWNTYLNDTWVRDSFSGEWEKISSHPSPSGRVAHEMVHVDSLNGIIMFGGYGGTRFNDTWLFDCSRNSWGKLSPTFSPGVRCSHAMSYDGVRDEVIVFGGHGKGTPSRQGFHNDTWVLDVKTLVWRNVTEGRSPIPTWDSRMVYDRNNAKHILFGGYGRIAGERGIWFRYLDETWMFDAESRRWVLLDVYDPPPGRYDHGMVYAELSGKVVLFGGSTSSARNDTWTFEFHLNRVFDILTESVDVIRYYEVSDEEDHWKEFAAYKTYWDLEDVDSTMGLWVKMKRDDYLMVVGTIPRSTEISLVQGWNLVGFPSLNSTFSVADLKGVTGATRVEGFDPSAEPYNLRILDDSESLQTGYGYWVRVESGITWVVPYQ